MNHHAHSPLPHNQVADIAVRTVPGGREMWVGTTSEGVAVLTFETGVPGDANGDGVVGVEDFLAVLADWGACPAPCPPSCAADSDGDCQVGVTDFLIVLGNWS